MAQAPSPVRNRLIEAMAASQRALIDPHLNPIALERGQALFEPGEDVTQIYFPSAGVIAALMLNLRDGASAEAAMIGHEGAVGGVISAGAKPAFTRAVVQLPGPALTLPVEVLERAKAQSPALRDHFARYGDCLLAQVLQSVACNAVHDVEARLARWLLSVRDRVDTDELKLTQDFMAEMLGVQRTYVTRIIKALEATGAIGNGRGVVRILDRALLERQACECYFFLRRHFERVLPNLYTAD